MQLTSSKMEFFAPLHHGPTPELLRIEVHSSFQIPNLLITGLASKEIAESRERIRAAIENSGFAIPKRRIVVHLAPASVPKTGSGTDLGIALALLAHRLELHDSYLPTLPVCAWGELGLDGAIRPSGRITRALFTTWKNQIPYLVIAAAEFPNALEAMQLIALAVPELGPPPTIVPLRNLREAPFLFATHHARFGRLLPTHAGLIADGGAHDNPNTAELLPLQPRLERLLGVTLAGPHHLLLLGPKGVGKSYTLEWLDILAPPLTPALVLERRLLAELSDSQQHHDPGPVRRVGTRVRPEALIGSASPHHLQTGEFSLAHGGYLVADEFPEWPRDSRESLREPLERGWVTLTRVHASLEMPARFTLIANGNFCPCGGMPPEIGASVTDSQCLCTCPDKIRRAYLARLSGPVLDRIDIVYKMVATGRTNGTASADQSQAARTRTRIATVRTRSIARHGCPTGHLSASQTEELVRHFEKSPRIAALLSDLTPRKRHKCTRLALTLASWDGDDSPSAAHFFEARCYLQRD